jgi:hypothetical protein
VWDGDLLLYLLKPKPWTKFPSPPCGMATLRANLLFTLGWRRCSGSSFRAHRVGWRLDTKSKPKQVGFLFRAHRVGWRQAIGNENFGCLRCLFRAHRVGWRLKHKKNPKNLFRAHRVGWRHQSFSHNHHMPACVGCSEPTVWDGDLGKRIVVSFRPTMFRAHRVGW